jgi:hypothetical protein
MRHLWEHHPLEEAKKGENLQPRLSQRAHVAEPVRPKGRSSGTLREVLPGVRNLDYQTLPNRRGSKNL